MSLITTLATVRNAAHAVAVSGLNHNDVNFLVTQGLLVKGTRSCTGKVFTKNTMRPSIDEVIKGYSSGHILSVLGVIKNAPTSVTKHEIAMKLFNTSYGTGVGSKVDTLVASGLVKQHRRKAGYYFTNPDKRELISALIAECVPAPVSTLRRLPASAPSSPNGFTLSAIDVAVLAKIKAAPHAININDCVPPAVSPADAALSIGFMIGLGLIRQHARKPGFYFTEPTKASVIAELAAPPVAQAPATTPGEVIPVDAVLALCRLSEHGISMNGIWQAFQKLIDEGLIRADKRDTNVSSKNVRYFVRKGGQRMGDIRAKADKRIAKLIAKNDQLVDFVNEAVDQTTGAGF